MNILLIFFALPIATIIFSIVLQKLLKCPILVAITIFAIFLIVTFAAFSAEFLVFAILYAILAFITAFITMIICEYLENRRGSHCWRRCRNNSDNCWRNCNCNNDLLTISSNCRNNGNGDLLTISSTGRNGNTNDLLTIRSNCENNGCNCSNCDNSFNGIITISGENGANTDNNNCGCNNNSNNNDFVARANIVPNSNGRSGSFNGCYRRR